MENNIELTTIAENPTSEFSKKLLIAKWLGWDLDDFGYVEIKDDNFKDEFANGLRYWKVENLKFDTDSNWQWKCLERISEELPRVSGSYIHPLYKVMQLLERFYNEGRLIQMPLTTVCKYALFESIVNYIKNKTDGTNNR